MTRPCRAVALIGGGDQAHEAAVRQVAQLQGHTIDRIVAGRAELEDLLGSAAGNAIEAVYLHRLADLGDQVSEAFGLLTRLAENGIAITTVVEGVSSRREGEVERVLAVLAAAAEMDHAKLVRNLRQQFELRPGRTVNGKRIGRRMTGGQRYGLRPFEDEVIAYMVRLRLRGLSHQAITDQLNSEGIPAAKRNGTWHRAVVRRVLAGALGAPYERELPEGRLSIREFQALLGISHHRWYAEFHKNAAVLAQLGFGQHGRDHRLSVDAAAAREFAKTWRRVDRRPKDGSTLDGPVDGS